MDPFSSARRNASSSWRMIFTIGSRCFLFGKAYPFRQSVGTRSQRNGRSKPRNVYPWTALRRMRLTTYPAFHWRLTVCNGKTDRSQVVGRHPHSDIISLSFPYSLPKPANGANQILEKIGVVIAEFALNGHKNSSSLIVHMFWKHHQRAVCFRLY